MIKTLLKSVREYKKTSILTCSFTILEVILECLIPFIMAKLLDNMGENSFNPIFKYGSILLVMSILSLILGILAGRFAAKSACGFEKNIRHDLYYSIQKYSFEDVDKFSQSSLVTRMTTDVGHVKMAYQMCMRIAIRAPLMIIFSFLMSLSINSKLSLIFLAILPSLIIVLFVLMKTVGKIFSKIFKKYDALNSSIQENVGGIRVVKSFAREEFEKEKLNKASKDVRDNFTKAERIIALNSPIMIFCLYVSTVMVSFIGGKIIINTHGSALTTGELSSLLNYGTQILSSLMIFSMIFVMISMSIASAKRICEVINHNPSLSNPKNGITVVKNGNIKFKNVSFQYFNQKNEYALKNIDLEIKEGEVVGIIGATGSSKSTLVQLIPRLYDVKNGEVLVGDVNVKEYDLDSLRNQVSMVLQKNVLFSGTIKDNLRWGNSEASDDELIRVCKLTQADEFITKFSNGYDTHIEQGGVNVSGGQKQRLCIARALLKKPKILILDDSTSAVDTKTDALIRQSLKNELSKTTKIIIAQRISSIQDADKIIVLDNGMINCVGTHTELLKSCEIYIDVYNTQIKNNSRKEGE